MMMTIEEMTQKARQAGASDLHLVCGLRPKIRRNGELEDLAPERMTQDDCVNIARFLAGSRYETLMREGELDLAGSFAGTRCRIHLFRQQGIPSLALRLLREEIPDLSELGLPPAVLDFPKLHKGIVLVTGETGSGKSTTLAALLDEINHTRRAHVVTLEDPVEYIYQPDLCVFNQREVGADTRSFADGLRASLREDPDVILIGEMRDRETIGTAITAAETGHLVFATLHSGSAAESVDRIVQVFPGDMQQQIRMQLSTTLTAVLTQQLIPAKQGGRVLACECMIVNPAIRNMIRKGDTPAIENAVSTSQAEGGQSMDQALGRLVKRRIITPETAAVCARSPETVRKNSF